MPIDESTLAKYSNGVSREEILALGKESALELLKELYARDPRPFCQRVANNPGSLEAVYYGITSGDC
jgi:hypothetical protein